MFINSSFQKLSNAKKVKMRCLFPYRDDDRRIDVPHFTIFRKRLKTLFQRPNFIKHEKRFYWLLNLFCLIPKKKILKKQNRKNNKMQIIKRRTSFRKFKRETDLKPSRLLLRVRPPAMSRNQSPIGG